MRLIDPLKSIFFLCDVQQIFKSKIHQMPALLNSIEFLIKSMKPLKVPVFMTEHYSKVFGHTCDDLTAVLNQYHKDEVELVNKRVFSMLVDDTMSYLKKQEGRDTVILTGIETHVCVIQTALDLLENNYKVVVVADAVSSQRKLDRDYALRRIEKEGGVLTTSEALVYELMQTSLHPDFKQILKFVKERQQNGNFFEG